MEDLSLDSNSLTSLPSVFILKQVFFFWGGGLWEGASWVRMEHLVSSRFTYSSLSDLHQVDHPLRF